MPKNKGKMKDRMGTKEMMCVNNRPRMARWLCHIDLEIIQGSGSLLFVHL